MKLDSLIVIMNCSETWRWRSKCSFI